MMATTGPFKVTQDHRLWYRSKACMRLPISEQVMWLLVTEVRSASFRLVLHKQHIFANCLPVRGAPWWVLLQHRIRLQRVFFIAECGIARFLCTTRVFKVRASSSPLGYLCTNFVTFVAPIAELARVEKSPTQSLTHPAYLMPREPKLVLQNDTSLHHI